MPAIPDPRQMWAATLPIRRLPRARLGGRAWIAASVAAAIRVSLWAWVWASVAVPFTAVAADEARPRLLRYPGDGRAAAFVPGQWGLGTATVANPGPRAIDVITATRFDRDAQRQYARRLWLPPRSQRTSGHPLLAPADLPPDTARAAVASLLIVPGPAGETIVPTPTGEMQHPGIVAVLHEPNRTAAIVDDDDRSARELVMAARRSLGLKAEGVVWLGDPLPPTRELLSAFDQLVIGSDRLLDDVAATEAVRQWLFGGGRLWLLADEVSPATIDALLGDAACLGVVDRVDLSRCRILDARGGTSPRHGAEREFAEPVGLVRVVAAAGEIPFTVAGWPAVVRLPAGRGEALLSTLDSRAWVREPGPEDGPPGLARSLATPPLEQLAGGFFARRPGPLLPTRELADHAGEGIAAKIVPRATVLAVLGAYCTAVVAGGLVLARRGRLELLGIAGPAAALASAAVLAGVAAASRTAVPDTVVSCQIAEVAPQVPDIRLHGALAAYRQGPSSEPPAARRGGLFRFAVGHQESRQQRMLWTDVDRWQLENAGLPPGVSLASFTAATAAAAPVRAKASFGPQGLVGRLDTGPFSGPADPLIATPAGQRRRRAVAGQENGRRLAVRLAADGRFTSRPGDLLARGEYFSAATLDDRQRRRRPLLERLLQAGDPPYPAVPTLLVWCAALDLGFRIDDDARRQGEALVAVPLEFDRPPPGTAVVVPAAFLPYRSVPLPGAVAASPSYDPVEQVWIGPLTAGSRTLVRFALPESVLPLEPSRASLELDIKAPQRVVTLAVRRGETLVELAREAGPVGTFTYTIDDPRALALDATGGWPLEISVGEAAGGGEGIAAVGWQIDDLRLEFRGTTRPPVATEPRP